MKVVITCAGKGTRLLPFTKELPKEMAPIFIKNIHGLEIKPLLQQIFENLYHVGIREYCFVTGRTKRSIEDHFSLDSNSLNENKQLYDFYKMLQESSLMWVNQLRPKGFGDAVYTSRFFVNNNPFIVQAGDVVIIPKNDDPVSKLISMAQNSDIEAAFLVREVNDPERHGIITVDKSSENFLNVSKAVEKPGHPESNLGIMPVYMFRESIFESLKSIKPGVNNEIQLTDAIQNLISLGKKVVALKIDDDTVLDVGTPESFWDALNQSHKLLNSSE